MWTFKIFGLVSPDKDEKVILAGVNNYLDSISRTTSKAKNKSMLDARLPFVYKHFYWNLNKDAKTWFEIFPNADINERWFAAEHKDCSWIIKVLFHDDTSNYDYNKSTSFIDSVLKSTSKDYRVLHEGKE